MDKFHTQALVDRKMRKSQLDQDTLPVATKKPTGWELHKPIFHLTWKGDDNWSTHIGSHTHYDLVVYPAFVSNQNTDLFDNGVEEYILKLAKYRIYL
jgi:hypothetical protein